MALCACVLKKVTRNRHMYDANPTPHIADYSTCACNIKKKKKKNDVLSNSVLLEVFLMGGL